MACTNPSCHCVDCRCGPNCACGKPGMFRRLVLRGGTMNMNGNGMNGNGMNGNSSGMNGGMNGNSNGMNGNGGACQVNDSVCREVEGQFKRLDPNAVILPGIGLPSENHGVCTITHAMPGMPNLKINGLESKSPLANNALFSTECADGQTLNLYEMMLPDVPSPVPGQMSSAEAYARQLNDSGLNVAGTHFHWWGTDPFVAAIHHQNVGMSPVDFAALTTDALLQYQANE